MKQWNIPSSDELKNLNSLVDLLQARAEKQAGDLVYRFIQEDGAEPLTVTYSELDRRARAIGAWLESFSARGERAVLLYPPGLDYIAAFFGCLYAGLTAVPAYPPRLNRPVPLRFAG
jgi:acyl-CoA synthetase (AMP-forming)/AMP-acid ligase II